MGFDGVSCEAASAAKLHAPLPLAGRPDRGTIPCVTASLDPLESTVENLGDPSLPQTRYGSGEHDDLPPASEAEQRAAHHDWPQERQWIYASLGRTGTPQRALAAFAACGGNIWVASADGEPVLYCNSCHSRHCQTCARRKRAALVAAVAHRLAAARDRCRFVTLTLRCQPVPLTDQLDRLYASFRRLRQRKFWRDRVTGGCLFIEIKLGENSGKWHVHAHCLVEGSFLQQTELAEEWHAVTGDSYIVDVRSIVEDTKVASYVAKYATKPLHSNVVRSPNHLDECVCATRGRRLVQTFGDWAGIDEEAAEPQQNVKMIGNLEQLMTDANAGDAVAIRWLEAVHRKWPTLLPRMRYSCPLGANSGP